MDVALEGLRLRVLERDRAVCFALLDFFRRAGRLADFFEAGIQSSIEVVSRLWPT